MSFSTKTDNLVKDLIQAEYDNACEKFGEKYHSLHEGYAVLLEEVEEAENEMDKIKHNLDILWKKIKNQDVSYDNIIHFIDCSSFYTIKELAQVGAVLMKIKNTIGEEE
jgi:SMC interacting uncharacterized protein involved in chromosome segregation